MSRPTSSDQNEILKEQLNLLLCAIYESKNCHAAFSKEGIIFIGESNGTISRGNNVHGAAMPALPFALGMRHDIFANQDSFHTHQKLLTDVLKNGILYYKFAEQDDSIEIRDRMLTYVLGRFFVSQQNYQYFFETGQFHHISGAGATESSNLCKSLADLSLGLKITVNSDDEGGAIIFLEREWFSGEVEPQVVRRFFSDLNQKITNKYFVELSAQQLTELLVNLEKRRINYHGVIPYDENGAIFLALRKSPYQSHILGYATCGGHCNDPYHPEVAAAHDLAEEFNIFSDKDTKIELIKKIGDVGIFVVDATQLDVTNFKAEISEFAPNTEEILSFKEIRDRKLPLRKIPSLDIYLKHCEKKLSEIFAQKWPDISEAEICDECEIEKGSIVQFPTENFGVIRFYSQNLKALQEQLQQDLGGEMKIDAKRNCVVIDDLNPRQIIDFIEGKKTKEYLEEYRQDQVKKAKEYEAAKVLGKVVRNFLARKDIEEKSKVNVGEDSRQNLDAIKERLRQGTKDGEFLEKEEREIFKTICEMKFFLFHCTSLQTSDAIDASRKLLSPRGMGVRGYKKHLKKYDPAVVSGLQHQIFFSIGTIGLIPDYFIKSTDVIYIFDLGNLIKEDKNFAQNAWMSENLKRFFYENTTSEKVKIGNVMRATSFSYQKSEAYKIQNFIEDSQLRCATEQSFGSNVCEASSTIPFIAYSFIEQLRFIKGSTQKYLMRFPDDVAVIEKALNLTLSSSTFMMHAPDSFEILSPKANVRKICSDPKLADDFLEAAKKGDLRKLEKLEVMEKENAPLVHRLSFLSKTLKRDLFFEASAAMLAMGNIEIIKWAKTAGFFEEMIVDFKMNCFGSRSEKAEKFFKDFEVFYEKNENATEVIKVIFDDLIKRGIAENLFSYFTPKTSDLFFRIISKEESPATSFKNTSLEKVVEQNTSTHI